MSSMGLQNYLIDRSCAVSFYGCIYWRVWACYFHEYSIIGNPIVWLIFKGGL